MKKKKKNGKNGREPLRFIRNCGVQVFFNFFFSFLCVLFFFFFSAFCFSIYSILVKNVFAFSFISSTYDFFHFSCFEAGYFLKIFAGRPLGRTARLFRRTGLRWTAAPLDRPKLRSFFLFCRTFRSFFSLWGSFRGLVAAVKAMATQSARLGSLSSFCETPAALNDWL